MGRPASRRFVSSLLIVAGLAAGIAVPASAQTAGDVVDAYLEALGGREALGKLTSRRATGTVSISTQAGDLTGPIEVDSQAPNKTRALITLDLTPLGGNGDMVIEQRFDGTAGVTLNSVQGDAAMPQSQVDSFKNSIFPTPLLGWRERGVVIDLLPRERIGDREQVVLLFTPKTGPATRLYFDPDTHLITRLVATISIPEVGEVEQTSDVGDYRRVDGVMVPFRTVNSSSIQTITIALTRVEHNVPFDAAIFSVKK